MHGDHDLILAAQLLAFPVATGFVFGVSGLGFRV